MLEKLKALWESTGIAKLFDNDIELFEMIMISFNYQDPAEYLLIER